MSKRGPHGTMRQPSPVTPGLAEENAAGQRDRSGAGGGPATGESESKRNDEYADHVVQNFRSGSVSTVKPEKKIVIRSREAATVKVKHEDLPALQAALAREHQKRAQAEAANGLPVHGRNEPNRSESAQSTSWIDDPDSFDAAEFSSEHAVDARALREGGQPQRPRSRWGLLLLLLGVALGGGAAAMWFLNGGKNPFARQSASVASDRAESASTAQEQPSASSAAQAQSPHAAPSSSTASSSTASSSTASSSTASSSTASSSTAPSSTAPSSQAAPNASGSASSPKASTPAPSDAVPSGI